MRRFEFSEGTSNKFWEIEQDGQDLNIRWGRIGTQGQSQTKGFADEAKATAAMTKLIDEKSGKGYVEAGVAAGSGVGKTAPKERAAAGEGAAREAVVAVVEPAVATATVPPCAAVAGQRTVEIDPDLAPWLAHGEPVHIHAAMLERALPSRRFPAPVAVVGNPAACIADIAKSARSQECQGDPGADPALARALQLGWACLEDPAANGFPEADAAMLALMLTVASYSYHSRIDPGMLVDALVGRDGLPAALDMWLHAQREFEVDREWDQSNKRSALSFVRPIEGPLEARWGCPVGSAGWAFRRHLAAADEAVYARCVERIRAAIPALHPSRQVVMALLLPDEPDISNSLALAQAGPQAHAAVHWLQLTATDPAAIAAIRKVKLDAYGGHILDHEEMVATLLRERGIGVLDMLASRAEGEVAGNGLLCFGTPEAIDALARAASSSRAALARLAAAAERWPLAAIVALSRLVAAGGKDGSLVTPSLAGLLVANEAALPALRPWLGAEAEAVVDRMLEQMAGPREVAGPDELPPVLGRPPWLAARRKAPVAAITDIEPLLLADVEDWAAGEREQATVLHPWQVERYGKATKDPAMMAAELGFDPQRRAKGDHVESAAAAIKARDVDALVAIWRQSREARKVLRYSYQTLNACDVAQLPDGMAIGFWNALAGEADSDYQVDYILARHGLQVVPGFKRLIRRRPSEHLALALHFGVVDFAPQMARAVARLRKLADTGREWLLRFPEHAACGLVADAVGKPGEARDCAGLALRLLAAADHRELVLEVARRYQRPEVVAAVEAVLAEDPLDRFPARRPPLPGFWQPRAWRRPVLADGPGAGKALPDEALEALGTMLAFPSAEGLYPGIEQVRDACTRESLADFAWDCFTAWLYAGAPSKTGWPLATLGLFGNDETARRLTPYIRTWPGEAAHARAVAALDVLATIGSDVALMLLNGIAQKVKFKGLQDRAREKIAQIAEARGLTTEELEDRLAPDLGLDERGTLLLDFGPRAFRVGFDEALKPYVRDADGARLADLPKPKKTDDAALSKAATERFKLLKKDVRTIAAQQVLRLELAMCSCRRWPAAVFRAFLVEHPLVCHLVQRLVWGVFEMDAAQGGSHGGRLETCFRVAEDGSFTDAADEPFGFPEGDGIQVGIPHALDLDPEVASAFGQLFADYELLQPFVQLGRETHVLTPDELTQKKLERWKGRTVPTGRILGLANTGWRRGQAQDGGGIWYFSKPLGRDRVIELGFEPGIIVGMVDEEPEQSLLDVQVGKPSRWGEMQDAEQLDALDPVSASELIRDLQRLCE